MDTTQTLDFGCSGTVVGGWPNRGDHSGVAVEFTAAFSSATFSLVVGESAGKFVADCPAVDSHHHITTLLNSTCMDARWHHLLHDSGIVNSALLSTICAYVAVSTTNARRLRRCDHNQLKLFIVLMLI